MNTYTDYRANIS